MKKNMKAMHHHSHHGISAASRARSPPTGTRKTLHGMLERSSVSLLLCTSTRAYSSFTRIANGNHGNKLGMEVAGLIVRWSCATLLVHTLRTLFCPFSVYGHVPTHMRTHIFLFTTRHIVIINCEYTRTHTHTHSELAVSYVEAQARITRALKDPKGRHPFVIRPSGSEAGCYAICLQVNQPPPIIYIYINS